MINSITPYSFYAKSIPFKGHIGTTEIKLKNGTEGTVSNFTKFFRNPETMKFTVSYLNENFPNGTHIADFGCSMGQKTYSLMVMLDKYNKNGKYKITGYDFPEVLEKASNRLYGIQPFMADEAFLLPVPLRPTTGLTVKEQEKLKKVFYKYFDLYPDFAVLEEEYELYNIQKQKNFSRNLSKDVAKKIELYELQMNGSTVVEPNRKADELVKFKPGDITNINRILKPGKTGVILFQNALYHILSGYDFALDSYDYPEYNISIVEDLFRKINKTLPKNGLFVMGQFSEEHLYDFKKHNEIHDMYFNNSLIKVFDTSPVHNALRKAGFEPVFYEAVSGEDVYVPTAWKKVRSV